MPRTVILNCCFYSARRRAPYKNVRYLIILAKSGLHGQRMALRVTPGSCAIPAISIWLDHCGLGDRYGHEVQK